MAPKAHKTMVGLPLSVVGPVDLGRLMREVEAIDNTLQALQIRQAGTEVKLPKTSQLLDETVQLNKLNLLEELDRKSLHQFLKLIHDKAPRLHISFSADPSTAFTQKLMLWLREQVNPVVLLTVGLQPSIGAGCVVRTTNKYFDLSLGKNFTKQRDLLMSKLRETPEKAPTPEAAQATAPVEPVVQAQPAEVAA